MKRFITSLLTLALLVASLCFAGKGNKLLNLGGPLQLQIESRNPWSHLRLNNGDEQFRFAIVSDRTGGHRAGVFSRAVEQINLLQPEFVLSIGDLIEGAPDDEASLARQWKEMQNYISRLQMPFFYAPGNHDIITPALRKCWEEKFGRHYYHFVYKNVLFLILNPYDLMEKDKKTGRIRVREKFSDAQLAFIKETLSQNAGVRWTIVALHPPIWTQRNVADTGWLDVEKMLADRPYTVFCGHFHTYQKYVRSGRNYYQLATTGGASSLRGVDYGEFDQLTWVTMKKDGPVIANLLLDGVLPDDLKKPVTDEPGTVPGYGSERLVPVRGHVYYQGSPPVGATIMFTGIDDATKRASGFASGKVEADGSFRLYQPRGSEGAGVGRYQVTASWTHLNQDGSTGPDLLPERYLKGSTSNLTATVTPSATNDFTFELRE
jgi:hypothetical protein